MWPFSLSAFGQLTVVAGLVVGVAGIGTWLREDGVAACNAKWELQVATANEKVLQKLADATARAAGLEAKLKETEDVKNATIAKNDELLASQRASYPENPTCAACRVANERIWVRKRAGSDKSPGGS